MPDWLRLEKFHDLVAIYAHRSGSDFTCSVALFTASFGRGPDAESMKGLAEWHHA